MISGPLVMSGMSGGLVMSGRLVQGGCVVTKGEL